MRSFLHLVDYKIGVLALQGAFAKHVEMLDRLEVPSLLVRYSSELSLCRGLIIPGGEIDYNEPPNH